jgi:hypothetical protein
MLIFPSRLPCLARWHSVATHSAGLTGRQHPTPNPKIQTGITGNKECASHIAQNVKEGCRHLCSPSAQPKREWSSNTNAHSSSKRPTVRTGGAWAAQGYEHRAPAAPQLSFTAPHAA